MNGSTVRSSTRPSSRAAVRAAAGLAAAALVGVSLPLATGGASAAPAPAPAAAGGARLAEGAPAFAGYAATTSSTPVRIEVYEQTIPVPASPQGELNFGYTQVEADSSTTRGRASYLWPGDAVGEGFKTIAEAIFPPEIAEPLAADGYPVQVNSSHPAGPPSDSEEPFPGTIQRTSASAEKTTAATGYSTDCRLGQPQPSEAGDGGDGGGGGGGGPVPGLPGLPVPGLEGLLGALPGPTAGARGGDADRTAAADAGARRTDGRRGGPRAARAEEEAECQIPAELAALVDVGGYVATSSVTRGEEEDGVERVRATSRSALGEVNLLGGIIQLEGMTAVTVTTSDGVKATTRGVVDYGTLTVAGQRFRYGTDGFEAAGQPQDVPGLPADPNQALEALGLQLLLPQPRTERDGDSGSTSVQGIQLVVDTTVLRQQLSVLPFDQISAAIGQLPFPEQADPLKSLLGAAVNLSPKFVITLGSSSGSVDTSPEIELPDTDGEVPDNQPGDGGGPGGGTGGTGGAPGGTGSVGSAPSGDAPVSSGGGGAEPALGDDGALTDAAPVGAGLPPLFSIPGALLFGGILAASVLGSYLRRLGVAALGGGSACAHGLDSGLPDLRKA